MTELALFCHTRTQLGNFSSAEILRVQLAIWVTKWHYFCPEPASHPSAYLVFAYFTDVEPSNKNTSFTKCFPFGLESPEPVFETQFWHERLTLTQLAQVFDAYSSLF